MGVWVGSSIVCWMDTMMKQRIGQRCSFITFGVLSTSLSFSPLFVSFFCSLRRRAQPSVQLPAATREPANLRPTQPTPADVPEWTLGWRGHGGRAGRVTQQTEGDRAKKWPWPLCLAWQRDCVCVCVSVKIKYQIPRYQCCDSVVVLAGIDWYRRMFTQWDFW